MKFLPKLRAALGLAWQVITDRYEATVHTPGRPWIPNADQSARFDVTKSVRTELVRRSDWFEKNNPLFNRLADIFELYTAGEGLQVSPSSSDPDWNTKAKPKFERWSLTADLSSLFPLSHMDSLAARTWFVRGEGFVVLAKDSQNRPAVQFVEGHLVCTPDFLKDQEGVTIIDGITIDKNGKPTGYYIASEDAKGRKSWGAPTPAQYVIHVFEPSRAGQYRGIPLSHAVLTLLDDLDTLQILEMKAAKEASRAINFITNEAGELTPAQQRSARYAAATTTAPSTTGTGSVAEARAKYYQESLGGETIVGKTGDQMNRLISQRPSVVVQQYWKELKSDICIGVGMPYVLAYPESMQGTVYRGAVDMAAAFFRARVQTLAEMKRRIYAHWANWARYADRDLADPPADWDSCTVHCPRAVNVDVGRNAMAEIQGLQAATVTYEDLYGPRGEDWREKFLALKAQQDFAESIGLKISFPGQANPANQDPNAPDPAEAPNQPANA